MKIIDFLKIKWREALSIEEEKEAFFHGCKRLIHSKHYDRLFRDFRYKGEVVYYSTEQDILYLKTKDSIIVSTNSYYDVFLEIFVNEIYTLPPQFCENDFVVFDIGMNRGYVSLFFANKKNCVHVYGFELMDSTFSLALENFNLNPKLKSKISCFNYGLWDEDREISIEIDEIDGHTSIKGVHNGITKAINERKAIVKKTSTSLLNFFEEINPSNLKVLKIDVEGSEYTIFKDLYENNVIQKFDLIIGEYHYGIDDLNKYLQDFNCSFLNKTRGERFGQITYINKKHSI